MPNHFTSRIFISFVFHFFLLFAVQSQDPEANSVKNELHRHHQKDSVRVNLLNQLAFLLRADNYEQATEYLEEAKTVADSLGFVKGKARCLLVLGIVRSIHTNNADGLEYFREALTLYDSIGLKNGIVESYESIGRYFYLKGDQAEAIENYHRSLEVAESIKDHDKIFDLLNRIGWSHIQTSNYPAALDAYKQSLEFVEEVSNQTIISHCYSDMAVIYSHQGNYPLSLEYFNKSLTVARENADSISIGNTYGNMGPVYDHLGDHLKAIDCYEQSILYLGKVSKEATASNLNNLGLAYIELAQYERARDYLKRALETYQELNNQTGIAFVLNNLGFVHLKLTDYETAYPFFERAREMNIKWQSPRGLCFSYLNIARVFTHQQQYEKAIGNALSSIELAGKHGLANYERDAHQLLSELYDKTGNFKKALASHQAFKILSDSLFSKENIEKIAQLESDYKYKLQLDSANVRELELTRTILATTRDLKSSQQNTFIAVTIILIISIISGSIIFTMKLRNVKVLNQNILMEQKLLRSQMTPHFIFNSLSVLQGMILNGESIKSVTYLSEFSRLIRTTLENSRHKLVTLSRELSAIQSYMELQNLDTNPPYNYSLICQSDLNTDIFKVPPMLIQPFVENAVEHAFTGKQEDKKIIVKLTFEDDLLQCTITDNGTGINKVAGQGNKDKSSLATTITSERLQMLSQDLGIAGSLRIQNRSEFGEKGTLVTLLIPYKIDSVV